MIKHNKPHCDWCRREMVQATESEDGCELWPWRRAEAHVCERCFGETFEREWKEVDPCRTLCETKPCKRGRDCWFMPPSFRNLPHETYYADAREDCSS